MSSYNTPARRYAPGIGDAVADRTINRKLVIDAQGDRVAFGFDKSNPKTYDDQIADFAAAGGHTIRRETWAEVAERVATGNSMLTPGGNDAVEHEFHRLHHHLRQASLLMSGRHLQHGDADQMNRPQEVFTNCSTAASTFLSFYLLLNGSGVGRAYDDSMMAVDYRNMPLVVPVIDQMHPDCLTKEVNIPDRRTAEHLYKHRNIHEFIVPDSREGWAKALEAIETLTFQGDKRDDVLLLDFSQVRCKGSPIAGMQNRPASGPGPLIAAIKNMALLRDAGMEPWRAAMYADHYIAECVLVGGARRAARMATKWWKDRTIFDFIEVKRGGFLWSSNNSVTVDQEFWDGVRAVDECVLMMGTKDAVLQQNMLQSLHAAGHVTATQLHAYRVFHSICYAAYHDRTGEPGLINVDKLQWSDEGLEQLLEGKNFAGSERYQLDRQAGSLMDELKKRFRECAYKVITNPCGEIVLSLLGGYCVIADVVPFHAGTIRGVRGLNGTDTVFDMAKWQLEVWDDDAEDAFRAAVRALMRVNLMDCLYRKEVKRTNRIGIGMTGMHEYAWARFGLGWKDIVGAGLGADGWPVGGLTEKNKPFWFMLARFSNAIADEARRYAAVLGVAVPHTALTMKPAGTTSKLFGLTEGAHLPAMLEYLRWVQFRNGDPLIAEYQVKGYPTRELKVYAGTTIVGFPTAPTICTLGMGDKLVTAAQATPEEQYEFLRLMERFWLKGDNQHSLDNQVSYTLKYDPAKVDYEAFKRTLLEGQSTIKCCSVMPQEDKSAYEYLPESPVTKHEFEQIVAAIQSSQAPAVKEDVDFAHVDCAGGACPIDFSK